MTSKEYEQRLEALEREIAALKREAVEEGSGKPPHPRWKPLSGNTFYTVESVIETGRGYNWLSDNNTFDKGIFEAGQVYQSKEQAEEEVERLKVLAQMREWAGKWSDTWELVYSAPLIAPIKVYVNICSAGEMRFATKEDALNCIRAVGRDRLIKYYFGVRDHEADAKTE